MTRICKVCKEEKELTEFTKHQKWRLKTCKKCRQISRRTGKPGHRFKKGHAAAMKGTRYSKLNSRISRMSGAYKGWKQLVKDRDGNKCVKCDSEENLHCHHIIPWKDKVELRYEISNGMTLCASCHCSIEMTGKHWNAGKVRTAEMRKKMSESRKGRIPWNKGLKGKIQSEDQKKKISESIKKHWSIRKANFQK